MKINCLLITIALTLLGCAMPSPFASIKTGVVITPDLTITAEDGSYSLTSGMKFTTPHEGGIGASPSNIRPNYTGQLFDHDGKNVRLSIGSELLYGALVFYSANNRVGCDGIAMQSHSIKVTQSAIDEALDGHTAFQYGSYVCDNKEVVSWALWFSDKPL